MTGLIMAAQLILGLSLLVFVHELGHFLAAKAFGMRVNKFYIFFDAWNKKIWSKTIGDTEYGIGWLPLGGYVQIAGMIDETQDSESLSEEPEPWEFRSKPAWQRFIVMIGGIVMNVITGLIIFTFYLHSLEKEYLPMTEVNKDGIYASQLAQEIGLQTGDKIVSVNGQFPERFKDAYAMGVLLGGTVTVDRNGNQQDVVVPDDFFQRFINSNRAFIEPMYQQIYVETIFGDSNAEKAGLQEGDQIKQINGKSVDRVNQLSEFLLENKGQTIGLQVQRNSQAIRLTAQVDTAGRLGFAFRPEMNYENSPYTWGKAMKYGYKEGYDLIASQIAAFGLMFTGKLDPRESVASPIGIARVYGGTWDWARFWRITGLLSFVLAFMNILPIPALDGGHMVFLSIEMITGRKFSDSFLEKAQIVGFLLLMCLIVFALGNDIYKLIFQ